METVSYKIWTLVTVSTSYDNNCYIMNASVSVCDFFKIEKLDEKIPSGLIFMDISQVSGFILDPLIKLI